MPIPQSVARFNRHVTNRITRTFADRLPGFAILIHTGRKSGKTYRIPINAFRDGDDYIFALTYGADTDWVRNVLAAGGCEIITRGRQIRLTNPRIISDPSQKWAPLPVRLVLGLINAPLYMRLDTGGDLTTPPTFLPVEGKGERLSFVAWRALGELTADKGECACILALATALQLLVSLDRFDLRQSFDLLAAFVGHGLSCSSILAAPSPQRGHSLDATSQPLSWQG